MVSLVYKTFYVFLIHLGYKIDDMSYWNVESVTLKALGDEKYKNNSTLQGVIQNGKATSATFNISFTFQKYTAENVLPGMAGKVMTNTPVESN